MTVDVNAEEIAYRTPPLPVAAQRHFLPGAGEGLPLPSMSLFLEGVIRIEGALIRYAVGISRAGGSPRTDEIHVVSPLGENTSCSRRRVRLRSNAYLGQAYNATRMTHISDIGIRRVCTIHGY